MGQNARVAAQCSIHELHRLGQAADLQQPAGLSPRALQRAWAAVVSLRYVAFGTISHQEVVERWMRG